jgi:hypothetical protein
VSCVVSYRYSFSGDIELQVAKEEATLKMWEKLKQKLSNMRDCLPGELRWNL